VDENARSALGFKLRELTSDAMNKSGMSAQATTQLDEGAPAEAEVRTQRVTVQTNVLQQNQATAEENRELFARTGTVVMNMMSAPGAGKTSILEVTLKGLRERWRVGVIEGDLQTNLDAERIRVLGVPSYQITTGTVCHLDARMIARALAEFPIQNLDFLVIENVGNLICPSSYFLGEHLRVVVCSVAEGADKPKKYPVMFNKADVVLLNKIDLIPYVDVDLETLRQNVSEVTPRAEILALSCKTGEGLGPWIEWLSRTIERLSSSSPVKARP
jgi:hydrogenase nickel incorporation protein HypB